MCVQWGVSLYTNKEIISVTLEVVVQQDSVVYYILLMPIELL